MLAIFAVLILTGNPWIFAILLCGYSVLRRRIRHDAGDISSCLAGQDDGQYGVVSRPGLVAALWASNNRLIKDKMPGNASTLSFIVGAAFVAIGFIVSLLIPSAGVSAKAPSPSASKR